MTTASPPAVFSTISEVERDVGVAKETLRVWERRYGFPQPARDGNGERIYPPEQVLRLVQIKRLLDQGYRPGKVVALGLEALSALGAKAGGATPARGADDPQLAACIGLLQQHRMAELRQQLHQAMLAMGLRRWVTELVAPLTTVVGDAWAAGQLAVFEEHLYSDMLQGVMRQAIGAATQQADHALASPRVLLTTVPQERHGLGLLMAEALLSLEGAHCISLGVQTPLQEIVAAARAQRIDIVALSFSGVSSSRATLDNLTDLRGRLDAQVDLWAGGTGAMLVRRHLGNDVVLDLGDIADAVARWRARQESVVV
ncbi:MAG: MerR family transcriptional regulator [Massilia sp.]